MKIEMFGRFNGQPMRVEVEGSGKKLKFLFNGEKDDFLETVVKNVMKMRYPVAGTYIADNWFDSVNVFYTLKDHIIENASVITAEGIETMPFESGVVY